MDNMVAIVELRQGHRIAVSGDADDVVAAALAVKERDELRHLCARLCRERDHLMGLRARLLETLRRIASAKPSYWRRSTFQMAKDALAEASEEV